jgi:cytochrome c-type biogenesis protein
LQLVRANAGLAEVKDGAYNAQILIRQVGGLLVVLLGLHIMGVTRWVVNALLKYVAWARLGGPGKALSGGLERVHNWLYMDTRREMNPNGKGGYLGSAMMGVVFGAGWSPCIGPILSSILTLAATATTGNTWLSAGGLLFVYSLGLGLPFLLAALALDQLRPFMRRINKHLGTINRVSGALMIMMGVLLFTGELERLAQAGGSLADFSYNFQECSIGVLQSRVPAPDWRDCVHEGSAYFARVNAANNAPTAPIAIGLPKTRTAEALAALPTGLEPGQRAPAFSLSLNDGTTFNLADHKEGFLLLNFWATWCAPCLSEMPIFQSFSSQYPPSQFRVLAVNFRETPEKVAEFLTTYPYTFAIGLDEKGKVSRDYKVSQGLPVSFLLDADGVVLLRHSGPFNQAMLAEALAAASQ